MDAVPDAGSAGFPTADRKLEAVQRKSVAGIACGALGCLLSPSLLLLPEAVAPVPVLAGFGLGIAGLSLGLTARKMAKPLPMPMATRLAMGLGIAAMALIPVFGLVKDFVLA